LPFFDSSRAAPLLTLDPNHICRSAGFLYHTLAGKNRHLVLLVNNPGEVAGYFHPSGFAGFGSS